MCFNLSPSLSLFSLSDLIIIIIIIIIVWRKKGQVDRQANRQAECEEVPLWLVGWLATYQVAKRPLLCIPDLTLLPLPALSDRKGPFFFFLPLAPRLNYQERKGVVQLFFDSAVSVLPSEQNVIMFIPACQCQEIYE